MHNDGDDHEGANLLGWTAADFDPDTDHNRKIAKINQHMDRCALCTAGETCSVVILLCL